MNNTTDIIYFTLFPWDNAYSSVSLSLTREFAKANRVFYINHPYSVKDFLHQRSNPMVQARRKHLLTGSMQYETIPGLDPEKVIAVHPPLVLPINFLSDGFAYRSLQKLNEKIVLDTIWKVIQDYKLKNFIYLNCFNPYFAGVLPPSFGAKMSIYECIDDMTQEPYTARHGARLEEKVIEKAVVALVTSRNLFKLKSPLNPNTHILHNAVDMDIFKNAMGVKLPRPKELEGINKPVIGFTGNLNSVRIDYPLLRKIAEAHPDKTLLLIGPLNSNDYKEHGLDQLPNVILTGGKDIKDLPQYLQHMDCAIIPFLKNQLTASIYPLKINEYLAAGKPVIATNFSEDIQSFRPSVYLAEDHEQFNKLIDRAMTEDSADLSRQRLKVAQSNTWEARVNQFWDIVDQQLGKPVHLHPRSTRESEPIG